jgi:hypothetical protein
MLARPERICLGTIGMNCVKRAGCIGGCASFAMECFSATSRGATTAHFRGEGVRLWGKCRGTKRGQVKNAENPGVKPTPGAPTSLRSATLIVDKFARYLRENLLVAAEVTIQLLGRAALLRIDGSVGAT